MEFDICNTILEVSKPFGQVNLQQITQQILQVSSEVRGEANLYVYMCVYTRVLCQITCSEHLRNMNGALVASLHDFGERQSRLETDSPSWQMHIQNV